MSTRDVSRVDLRGETDNIIDRKKDLTNKEAISTMAFGKLYLKQNSSRGRQLLCYNLYQLRLNVILLYSI